MIAADMLSTSVLKHPQGAAVVERITESLTPRQGTKKDLLRFSSGSVCKRRYHLDRLPSGSLPALGIHCNSSPGDYESGKEFHWGCALRYLVSPALHPRVVQAPQFCFFSTVHQYQVLVLMINQRCRLPTSAMRDFVSKVKERIFGDAWCAFLLHRLELDGSHDMNHCCQTGETCTSGDSEVYSVSRMGTALSPAMLQRVQGIAETISLAAGTSHRHEDSFKNVGIRSLQLNGVEPFNFDSVVDPVNDQSLVQEVEGEKEQKETIEDGPLRKRRRIDTEAEQSTGCLLPALSGEQADACKTGAHVFEAPSVGLEADVKDIRDSLLAGQVVSQESFDSFMTLGSKQIERVLSQGDCPNLTESAVIAIIQNLVSSTTNLSYHSGITLLRVTTLPLLEGLQQSVSRSLLLALSSLVNKLPRISSDGLLVPLVKCKQFGAVHADLLTKVIKDVMTAEQKESFWRDLISIRDHEITDPFIWNESVVDVAQVLVDKVRLDGESATAVISSLQRSAIHLKQSSKFAKFLIELVNRNSEILSPMASSLVALASTNKSMMKASLMRTVKKLCV